MFVFQQLRNRHRKSQRDVKLLYERDILYKFPLRNVLYIDRYICHVNGVVHKLLLIFLFLYFVTYQRAHSHYLQTTFFLQESSGSASQPKSLLFFYHQNYFDIIMYINNNKYIGVSAAFQYIAGNLILMFIFAQNLE